jgi:hypothetical protein
MAIQSHRLVKSEVRRAMHRLQNEYTLATSAPTPKTLILSMPR